MAPRKAGIGIAATIGAAVLWGSSFSVNDVGLRHVGSGTFALLRFAVAGLVTLGVLALLGRANTRLLRTRWFWGLALANALAFLLQYAAQTMTTPARTALFVNTSAFTVALIERVLYRRSLGARRWLAIALGFVGATILIVGGDPVNVARGQTLGDVLAMLAGIVWAVFFVMNDRAVERENPIHLTAWTFVGTAIVLLPAPLLDPLLSHSAPLAMSPQGALAIAYSGLITTALAFGLWTWGLTRIRASISAVLLMIEILVASLISIALGRETFGLTELVGAMVLVGAVLLASSVAKADAATT